MSAAALLAACSKETPGAGPAGYGVVDPMPSPALDRNKPDGAASAGAGSTITPTDAVTGPPDASAAPSASASAPPHKSIPKPPPTGHGYGVVDPMPSPALRVPKKGDPSPSSF
jgi:hypothetical protein